MNKPQLTLFVFLSLCALVLASVLKYPIPPCSSACFMSSKMMYILGMLILYLIVGFFIKDRYGNSLYLASLLPAGAISYMIYYQIQQNKMASIY